MVLGIDIGATKTWLARIESGKLVTSEKIKTRSEQSFFLADLHALIEAFLDKELNKIEDLLERSRKKLANQDFLERAKPDVVERERQRSQQLEATLAKIDRALSALED